MKKKSERNEEIESGQTWKQARKCWRKWCEKRIKREVGRLGLRMAGFKFYFIKDKKEMEI